MAAETPLERLLRAALAEQTAQAEARPELASEIEAAAHDGRTARRIPLRDRLGTPTSGVTRVLLAAAVIVGLGVTSGVVTHQVVNRPSSNRVSVDPAARQSSEASSPAPTEAPNSAAAPSSARHSAAAPRSVAPAPTPIGGWDTVNFTALLYPTGSATHATVTPVQTFIVPASGGPGSVLFAQVHDDSQPDKIVVVAPGPRLLSQIDPFAALDGTAGRVGTITTIAPTTNGIVVSYSLGEANYGPETLGVGEFTKTITYVNSAVINAPPVDVTRHCTMAELPLTLLDSFTDPPVQITFHRPSSTGVDEGCSVVAGSATLETLGPDGSVTSTITSAVSANHLYPTYVNVVIGFQRSDCTAATTNYRLTTSWGTYTFSGLSCTYTQLSAPTVSAV